MSLFSSELADINAALQYEFGDPVTWISQNPSVAPYALPGASGDGTKGTIIDFATEQVPLGFYAVLRCVLLADLAPALAGSSDLSVLAGDQVTYNGVTYRVQKVTDPDYSGTVTVELRKPSQ